jgi:hypothetical protein
MLMGIEVNIKNCDVTKAVIIRLVATRNRFRPFQIDDDDDDDGDGGDDDDDDDDDDAVVGDKKRSSSCEVDEGDDAMISSFCFVILRV